MLDALLPWSRRRHLYPPACGAQPTRRHSTPVPTPPRCADDVCTQVCQRGSVVVEPWLDHAVRQQARLVQSLPLCWATLLGTHNSAITLADGYGNLDEYFRGKEVANLGWVGGRGGCWGVPGG